MGTSEVAVELRERKEKRIDVAGGALRRVADATGEGPAPATVAHVADFHHRYPGEVVTFHTRVEAREPLTDLTLRITLPTELVLGDYRAPPELNGAIPYVEVDERANYLVWSLKGTLPAGTRYEYRTEARVAPTTQNLHLASRAVLTNGDHLVLAEETASCLVWAKGRYVRHLPELYEQDEFMGRFLMLFESFWSPIETQIGNVASYFDSQMTPARFLPWLASWVGLELNGRLTEEQQRRLIRAAVWLFRRRGTRQALREYLEIYTGGQVQIIEHRANDFRLGPEARLGPGVALGTGNRPHTFTVILRLPPLPAPAGEDGEEERARLELDRRRAIEAIIETEKPAHTDYTLRIETVPTE